jgi:hypothetical protein
LSHRERKRSLLIGVVTAAVFGSFLLYAFQKYLSGNGLDTYRTVKGALMNYAGAVVTGGLFVLCMAVAFGVKWWHHRQERKFEQRLRARASAPNTANRESAGTGS